MTIATETTKSRYDGNGVATVFAYGFKIVDETHLSVIEADDNDLATTLVLGVDYTVSDVGEDAGGNVTLLGDPTPTGSTLTLIRSMPLLQSTDYNNQGGFYADTHEDGYDELTMMMQQQQEQIDRAVKVSETSGLDGDSVLEQLDLYEASCAASADSASTSETNAATSETNAATSETNAATSETNAANSASAAAGSAATINTPDLDTGDEGKTLIVNSAEDGYDHAEYSPAPIGSLMTIAYDFSAIPTIGDRWKQCDGTLIDDTDSVFNGKRALNLNGADVLLSLTWVADPAGAYAVVPAADITAISVGDSVSGVGITDVDGTAPYVTDVDTGTNTVTIDDVLANGLIDSTFTNDGMYLGGAAAAGSAADQMQGHYHTFGIDAGFWDENDAAGPPYNVLQADNYTSQGGTGAAYLDARNYVTSPKTDGANGAARSGSRTRPHTRKIKYVMRIK